MSAVSAAQTKKTDLSQENDNRAILGVLGRELK
jgi:hypothetical protein